MPVSKLMTEECSRIYREIRNYMPPNNDFKPWPLDKLNLKEERVSDKQTNKGGSMTPEQIENTFTYHKPFGSQPTSEIS